MSTQTPPSLPPGKGSAARAQRPYRRDLRRPSILGPLVLIAVGTTALLVELGRLSVFRLWGWYVRWWPLLIIAVGTVSLAEWWFDRGNPYGRRHRYGGIVALLIFLALFGYVDHGLSRLGPFYNQENGDPIFRLFGEERSSEFSLNREIPASASLQIQVPSGDVTVTVSGDSQIHVQADEKVYASNDRDAQRAFQALRPQLGISDKNVSLRVAAQRNGRTNLMIAIPNGAAVAITAGQGDVTVEGVKAPLELDAENGDVKLIDLKTAHVRMRKGDFVGHAIAGDLFLQGKMEDVSLSDVGGNALLDGDFFGDMHIARVASRVHVHSSRTAVDLGGLPGDLSLDSDDLQITNPTGPIKIATKAKDIECTGVSQDAEIENDDGDIELRVVGQPGAIHIENRNGDIHLILPGNAHFTLQATAKEGEIHSEFALPVSGANSGQSLSGSVGNGGPTIELISDHGDIQIGKGDSSAAKASSEPAEKGKGVRRFRSPPGATPATESQ